MSIGFFATLGDAIESRWAARSHGARAFGAVVRETLQELPPHQHVGLADLVRAVAARVVAPQAYDPAGRFGQPPVTVYCTDRFRIDVLLWVDGTTVIHQHGFDGAFTVLEGSSVHAAFDFAPDDRVNEHLALGALTRGAVEYLRPGDVREIVAGDAFIHSLFHLDRPSVSVVIRTHHSAGMEPQYSYLAPGVAYDPFYEDTLLQRQLQLLESLHASGAATWRELLGLLVQQPDLHLVFEVLHRFQRVGTPEELHGALDLARTVHGGRVERLARALSGVVRENQIIERRAGVHEPGARYLLALLLNLPHRPLILDFVRRRHADDDPADRIVRWVEELSQDPAASGIAFGGGTLLVLRSVLERQTPSEIAQRLEEGGWDAEALPEILDQLRGSLFGPLFVEP